MSWFAQYRYVISFAILSAVLLVPYTLRIVSSQDLLEPYPAIMLPAGASTVKRDTERFEFTRTQLFGIDPKSGDWKSLDATELLRPVPVHFLNALAKNRFGLDGDQAFEVRLLKGRLPTFHYDNASSLTADKIDATRRWFRERLTQAGCQDDRFQVRDTVMTVNLTTREVTELQVEYEETYTLY